MTSLRKSQPKLKDSCDNCAAAKVRCGKEKPACNRCHEKAHSCVYSYSCRAGRHLVKGDRNSPPLGRLRTPSITASPTFSYSLPMESSAGYLDTMPAYSLSSPSSYPYPDSYSGMYTSPTNYSYSPGSYSQMPYSISPEHSLGPHESTTSYDYLSRKQSRSESQSSSTSALGMSSLSLSPGYATPSVTHDPQWGSTDMAYLNLGTTSCTRQYMLGGSQNCLHHLLSSLGTRPEEYPHLTEFNISDHSSIITASNILNRAFKAINDPIAINKTILDLASSSFSCQCSYTDSRLQHLLVAVGLNVMARYSSVAFKEDNNNPHYQPSRHRTPSSRAGFVLDELHRVASFLDSLDRRLQQQQSQFRTSTAPSSLDLHHGSSSSSSPSLGGGGGGSSSSAYAAAMGAIPMTTSGGGTSVPYSSASSSASSSSSGIASSSDYSITSTSSSSSSSLLLGDPGFAFSAVELRRRLQALRTDIISRMRTS